MKELLAVVLEQLLKLQAGLDADVASAHDQGFKEGVASVVADPSKVFSQEDLDKSIADFKAIILAEIQKDEANLEALLK